MNGADALAQALLVATTAATRARWFTEGVITGYSDGQASATIDGVEVTGIHPLGDYWTPEPGQSALFAVIRGASSVLYVGVGAITDTDVSVGLFPATTVYPSPSLYPEG